jgi:hypothetical protein
VFNVESCPQRLQRATNVCGNASSPVPLFSSHVNSIIRPSLQSSTARGAWPVVHGKRLDVFHNTKGGPATSSKQVRTSTHIPYSTGIPGKPVDGERKPHGVFHSFEEAGKSIDKTVG